jgi:ATP-dependent RNA helicase DDX55/SPB4
MDGRTQTSMWARFPYLPHSITQPCFCWQWDTYAYSEDAQERKRLQGLESRAQVSAENEKNKVERLAKKKANVAWSTQALKKETRDKRKDKKVKKKQWLKSQPSQPPSPGSEIPQKRGLEVDDEDEDNEDDWAELAREERMAKKVRKGEVTQLEFDAEFIP